MGYLGEFEQLILFSEERGLVRSWVGEPGSGPGRPRKYYAIEPAGAGALMESHSTISARAGGTDLEVRGDRTRFS